MYVIHPITCKLWCTMQFISCGSTWLSKQQQHTDAWWSLVFYAICQKIHLEDQNIFTVMYPNILVFIKKVTANSCTFMSWADLLYIINSIPVKPFKFSDLKKKNNNNNNPCGTWQYYLEQASIEISCLEGEVLAKTMVLKLNSYVFVTVIVICNVENTFESFGICFMFVLTISVFFGHLQMLGRDLGSMWL